jgi:UDP-glucose 4-epimerase
MRKVLITGVAGFLGSHLADRFLLLGWKVVGIDNLIGGYPENVPNGVDFVSADLGDVAQFEKHFKDVDLVVHAACTAYEGLSVFSPALVVQNTTQITANLLSLSVKHQVKKFIYLSSMARYGAQESPFREEMQPTPQDPYGIAKYAAELLVENICSTHNLKYLILVPHNIIGPRQKFDDPYRNVASIMANRILHDKQIIIYGDGLQKRCFSFISDVTNPIMTACLDDSLNGEIINIGPDEQEITVNELGVKISSILGVKFDPIYMPGRPNEVFHATCSADKARKLLDYRTTTDLDSGLKQLVDWIKDQPRKDFSYHLPLEIVNEKTPRTWSEKLI